MKSFITYYSIAPCLPIAAPISLSYQDQKDELFVGPHVRLSGYSGKACINSELLALKFAEACISRFRMRYGNETRFIIHKFEEIKSAKITSRIQRDSDIVTKRLEANNFFSNKPP